jgi:predicted DNA binding protein
MANPVLQSIQSLEILNFLKFDREETAAILRVKFKDHNAVIGDIFPDTRMQTQLLEELKDGSRIYFFRMKGHNRGKSKRSPIFGAYPSIPFEVQEGKVRMTFLGNAKEINLVLKQLEKIGVHYRVRSVGDAKFSPNSPLSYLTEKQRRVIIAAFNFGYYDLPRRINSEALADKFGIRPATLVRHRIKAERRILAQILDES